MLEEPVNGVIGQEDRRLGLRFEKIVEGEAGNRRQQSGGGGGEDVADCSRQGAGIAQHLEGADHSEDGPAQADHRGDHPDHREIVQAGLEHRRLPEGGLGQGELDGIGPAPDPLEPRPGHHAEEGSARRAGPPGFLIGPVVEQLAEAGQLLGRRQGGGAELEEPLDREVEGRRRQERADPDRRTRGGQGLREGEAGGLAGIGGGSGGSLGGILSQGGEGGHAEDCEQEKGP